MGLRLDEAGTNNFVDFPYRTIQLATDNFCKLIGVGSLGTYYFGTNNLCNYAIKRLNEDNVSHGNKAYIEEVIHVQRPRLSHPHIVELFGLSTDVRPCVVYAYLSNGTLREALVQKKLPWRMRLSAIKNVGLALHFLHFQKNQSNNRSIAHGKITTKNILLDDNYGAKLGDFGHEKRISDYSKHVSHAKDEKMIYLPEDFCNTQQLTAKTDMYSYGVVILEILTGKTPLELRCLIETLNVDGDESAFPLYKSWMDPSEPDWPSDCWLDLLHSAANCIQQSSRKRWRIDKVLATILSQSADNPPIQDPSAAGVPPIIQQQLYELVKSENLKPEVVEKLLPQSRGLKRKDKTTPTLDCRLDDTLDIYRAPIDISMSRFVLSTGDLEKAARYTATSGFFTAQQNACCGVPDTPVSDLPSLLSPTAYAESREENEENNSGSDNFLVSDSSKMFTERNETIRQNLVGIPEACKSTRDKVVDFLTTSNNNDVGFDVLGDIEQAEDDLEALMRAVGQVNLKES